MNTIYRRLRDQRHSGSRSQEQQRVAQIPSSGWHESTRRLGVGIRVLLRMACRRMTYDLVEWPLQDRSVTSSHRGAASRAVAHYASEELMLAYSR